LHGIYPLAQAALKLPAPNQKGGPKAAPHEKLFPQMGRIPSAALFGWNGLDPLSHCMKSEATRLDRSYFIRLGISKHSFCRNDAVS
jgi:hypothetical protein